MPAKGLKIRKGQNHKHAGENDGLDPELSYRSHLPSQFKKEKRNLPTSYLVLKENLVSTENVEKNDFVIKIPTSKLTFFHEFLIGSKCIVM